MLIIYMYIINICVQLKKHRNHFDQGQQWSSFWMIGPGQKSHAQLKIGVKNVNSTTLAIRKMVLHIFKE